jgi:ubiquinone/menaquinone biosynthesis C-methylase UbiE
MTDAETYDTYLVPAIFEPWSRDLIKRAQVFKGDRVLDVACGTGIVACRIAGTGAAVTAIDSSAEYLERAKLRASEEGVGVKWLEGTAEALPFRQPAFDLVTCQHGLQFFGDRVLALREMRRVIAPGGRAVIATWGAMEKQGPYAALDDLVHARTGKRRTEPTSLSDPAVLNKLLLEAKFFAVNVETATRQVRVPEPERFARVTTSALLGESADDALVADAMTAIAPFTEGEQLTFPMTALLAVGRVKT